MSDAPGPWGPYRAAIEDHVDTCTDYLDRLRRSLAGEIASDRHSFADKAHQLHAAAQARSLTVEDRLAPPGRRGVETPPRRFRRLEPELVEVQGSELRRDQVTVVPDVPAARSGGDRV